MQRATVIEHLIQTLALRTGDHCDYVEVLRFEAVEECMRDRGARVLSTGDPYPNESVVYRVALLGKSYDVRVTRSINRTGVLITSKFSEL